MAEDAQMNFEAAADEIWQSIRAIAAEYPNVGAEIFDRWAAITAVGTFSPIPRNFSDLGNAVAQGRPADFSTLPEALQELIPYQRPANEPERRGLILRLLMLKAMSSCQHSQWFHRAGNQDVALLALLGASEALGELHGVALGYSLNTSLRDRDAESVRRAANGRRLIGATTRDRVRAAAEHHRHLPKGTAAFEIADKLNMSHETVRKLLSKIFPGDAWGKSSDSTGRNN